MRDKYNRDGYVVAMDIISPDIILSIFNDINKLFCQQLESPSQGLFKNMLSVFNADVYLYASILKLCAKLLSLQSMFLCDEIKQVTNILGIEFPSLPTQPVIHGSSEELKIPDGYHGAPVHQDWPSLQGSLDVITIWIPFTDVSVGLYPIEAIPGSHLRGLCNGHVSGSVLELDIECDEKDFMPIECSVGDVVFMSGFTIHRTGKGNGFRLAASQRYENCSEATFMARGYPCVQKRVVDRSIAWKPSIEQIRKVYA